MFYVLCFMFYVLCFMFYVLCFMFYVLVFSLHVCTQRCMYARNVCTYARMFENIFYKLHPTVACATASHCNLQNIFPMCIAALRRCIHVGYTIDYRRSIGVERSCASRTVGAHSKVCSAAANFIAPPSEDPIARCSLRVAR